MSDRQLLVGVARAGITPAIGVHLAGSLRDEPSSAIERGLTVTALALSDEHTELVIVACDLLALSVETAWAIRTRIAKAVGISTEQVLVNVSHTHGVPPPPFRHALEDEAGPEEIREIETYYESVQDQAVGVAKRAHAELRPGRAGFASGAVRIGVNRRERLPDGTMVLGENVNGIVDPTVSVVRFDDDTGCPVAMLLHYACHPDVLGPKATLISPDYVGVARAVAERVVGAPVVFLQGAAGDIDPRVGIVNGPDGIDEMNRLGTELGCEAARVFQSVNTTRQRHQRVTWKSAVSVVTGWDYAAVTSPTVEHLSATSRRVELPLGPLPSREAAENVLAQATADLNRIKGQPNTRSDRLVARVRVQWATLQLKAVLENHPPRLELEIQAMRLNDIAIVGIPGELFVEIGMAIKEHSPIKHTLVCGYTNGVYFYIPTSRAFSEGGYEVESHRNYYQPMGPTPEWEGLLQGYAHDVLGHVSDAPAGAPRPFPNFADLN